MTATLRRRTGSSVPLALDAWHAPATAAERALLAAVDGPVIDLGCGPGRLVVALGELGTPALGVDASPHAVDRTQASGATAICRSVFDRLPAEGRWRSALLFDGNVGIGGDPTRILTRVAQLLAPSGSAYVETAAPDVASCVDEVRLEVDDHIGPWFAWAWVSADHLETTAADAGLRLHEWLRPDGRFVARSGARVNDAVDVILPVLNEAEALPWILRRMPDGYRAIVVDNGSTDGSADIARASGACVVHEAQRGFGAACFRGLVTARADIVAFMDGDGSLDPAALVSVVDPVRTGAADLVLGARRADRGAWPLHARAGNRVVARRVRRLTGVPLTDLGPMRAAPRLGLLELHITDRRSGWPLEMVLRAAAANWAIREVDVRYARRSGRSKVTGTVRGTINAVGDMQRQLRSFTTERQRPL